MEDTRDLVISRNNVKVIGQGTRVLMFANGFGCDLNTWRMITPAFDKEFIFGMIFKSSPEDCLLKHLP